MKRAFTFALILMLFTGFVSAQETESGGVGPDSALWGIDRALERIQLVLTFNEVSKEKVRLEHARERLLEVRERIEAGDVDNAEDARRQHELILERTREKLSEIDSDDIEGISEIEDNLDSQGEEVEKIRTRINIEIEGSLTEEQKTRLRAFLASLSSEGIEDVKVRVRERQSDALLKIEAETGKPERDLIEDFRKVRERKEIKVGIGESSSVVKIEQRFLSRNDGEDLISEIVERFYVSERELENILEIKRELVFDEGEKFKIEVKKREVGDLIVNEVEIKIREGVESVDVEELRDAIVRISALDREEVKKAIKFEGKSEREIEIEVEVEDGNIETEVKIEWDGRKTEFELNTDDKNEIITEIAERLGVSEDEVRNAIKKFEVKHEDDDNLDDSDDDIDDDSNGNSGSGNSDDN